MASGSMKGIYKKYAGGVVAIYSAVDIIIRSLLYL